MILKEEEETWNYSKNKRNQSNFKDKHPFGPGRGNIIVSCFYNVGLTNSVTYISLLPKKITAIPLIKHDIRIYV